MKFSKLILLTFVILTLYSNDIFSQIKISGRILSNDDSLPISEVHILINGIVVATSKYPDGNFSFISHSLPVIIELSHIAYETEEFKIKKPSDDLLITLSKKVNYLKIIGINALPQRNIIKDKKIYVVDYCFEGDSILLLAFQNLNENHCSLILINSNGDTLCSRKLDKADYIYSDCFSNNHLISKTFASQIFVDYNDIKLLYKVKKDSFLNIFKSIVAYNNQRFYIREDFASNQKVNIYIFDSRDSSFKVLREIVDDSGLERLSDKSRLQSYKDYTPADARFEEMCFYNKKPITLMMISDSIVIFNTLENKIEVYNGQGKLLFTREITFHLSHFWDKKFIQDKITSKIFTQFTKYGITTIAEVNLENGSLKSEVKIPQMNCVEKISVNNNRIYFLYNDLSNHSYKQIYTMNYN